MVPNKRICIISGGTISKIAPHLALSAPAYGTVGHELTELCEVIMPKMDTTLYLTKMAGGVKALETNQDVERLITDTLLRDMDVKVIILAAALCDFELSHGPYEKRFKSDERIILDFKPAKKLLPLIREKRKDIFAVGFATTSGATEEELYLKGLRTLKKSSVNLVLANDIKTGLNMVVTPEESFYHKTTNRKTALRGLVEMISLRSHLTFTQSTVVAGEPISWQDERVSPNLRAVVDHFIARGAYKPFLGKTAGHFAQKVDDQTFLTSRRKTNFNELDKLGLVLVKTDGPDTVLAYGAKPSVGGQSQRIVFKDHPGYDCIAHAHVPLKKGSTVPVRSQREFECGSHECGKNTSKGLKDFGDGILAVYLENHGPNIVFRRDTDPAKVIAFAEDNFDLTAKTGMNVWDDIMVYGKEIPGTEQVEPGIYRVKEDLSVLTKLLEDTTNKVLQDANMTRRERDEYVDIWTVPDKDGM